MLPISIKNPQFATTQRNIYRIFIMQKYAVERESLCAHIHTHREE